jgi:threonine synthase
MRKSGRTPLIRAKKLEKALNIGEIFLKLEGDNPSGHKYDRITEVLVNDATLKGFKQILVDGCTDFIKSVMFFANLKQLKVKVPDLSKDTLSHTQLKDLAKENNMYYTGECDLNTTISHLVLEDMTKECLIRMNFKLDTITLQLGYDHTLSSIYSGLIKSFINEDLLQLPQLLCTSTSSCQDTSENTKKDIIDTHAKMIDIEEIDLSLAASMLLKYEDISISIKESYALAAFIKEAQSGLLKNGKH